MISFPVLAHFACLFMSITEHVCYHPAAIVDCHRCLVRMLYLCIYMHFNNFALIGSLFDVKNVGIHHCRSAVNGSNELPGSI